MKVWLSSLLAIYATTALAQNQSQDIQKKTGQYQSRDI